MVAQGVPARVAMEVLGHAQISTTMNIYSHVAPEFQKEASDRVAAVLWPRACPRVDVKSGVNQPDIQTPTS